MSDWLDLSDNANCFKQTYVQGFLDISGGSIISRGTEHGLVIGGDSSLNGTVYLGDSIFVRSDGLVAPPIFVDASYADVSGGAFIGDVISYDISGGPNVAGSTLLSSSLSSDASWSQLGFDIDGEARGDNSGYSVSLINSATYGRVVAIGAYYNDGTTTNTSDNRGHVRVYQHRTIVESDWTNYNITDASYNGIAPYDKPIVVGASGDATPVSGKKYWVQMGGDIDGEAAGDESGQSVSLVDASGSLVVAIGAKSNDGTPFVNNSGHVRVYQYDATKTTSITNQNSLDFGPVGWRRLGGDIDGEAEIDRSGISVSLLNSADGLVVAIGAFYNDGTAVSTNISDNRGHVRVYQYDANKNSSIADQASADFGPIGWRRLGADIDGEATRDESGVSVSLVDSSIGLVVAIGANNNDGTTTNTSDNRGHVRVYQYRTIAESDWTNYNITDASYNGIAPYDKPIAVGASGDATPVSGKKYWVQMGGDIDGEAAGDQSGYSVSLVDSSIGLVVAIGAYNNDGTTASDNRGHARVYQYDVNKTDSITDQNSANYGPIGWRRLGADIDGEAVDNSGWSVSLVDSSANGIVVAIGAISNNDGRGHVRVYQYVASKNDSITDQTSPDYGPIGWRRLGVDIDGEAAGDQSGFSVSLADSADGLVVAIGAYQNDGIVASRTFKVRSDGFIYTIDGFAGNFPVITLQANTVYYFDVSEVSSSHPFALRNSSGDTTAVTGTTNNFPDNGAGLHQGSPNTIITYTRTNTGTIVYQCVNHSSMIGTINIISSDNRGHVRVYEIPYTNVYSDVSGGFFDVQVASNGATPFYVDVSGGPDVAGSIAKPDLPGGPNVAGSTLNATIPSDASWNKLGDTFIGATAGEFYGNSVSLSSDGSIVAIVGPYTNIPDGLQFVDVVRVYEYVGASWVQLGVDIVGENGNTGTSQFGKSDTFISLVDASGGPVVAIGNNTFAVNKGNVRVYQYNGSTWNKLGANIESEDFFLFGKSVSLIETTNKDLVLAVAAQYALIYQYNGVSWDQLGGYIPGEIVDDDACECVSLVEASGGLAVAIGAPNYSTSIGIARVFQYNGSTWSKLGATLSGPAINYTAFGFRVALTDSASGLVLAVVDNGYRETTFETGKLYTFQYNGSAWIDIGTINSDPFDGNNMGGVSLVNTPSGLILAKGHPAYSIGGARSHGLVRAYKYVDASWVQLGQTIIGETVEEQLGYSVALSANGLNVVAGAYLYDIGASDRGAARVYEITNIKTYSDVSNGYFDVSIVGGYLNDGLTTAALYVKGDTDLSGGLTVGGDVSFNAGNLFVAGDLSINGILSVGAFAPNSIGAGAINSAVDINFANKLSVSVADLSFSATGIQVATDFSLNNTPIALDANLTVPANIAIVDGSNGTVYGSYLTLTNKAATAYYNVGKSASGLFNIVDQANAGVYLTAGGTSFTGTSDARLKTNIAPLESATDKIMALNPCTYQWKSDLDDTTEKASTNAKTHIGFIAQEVEQVMPELVHPIDHPAGPDYKGVNTTDMIPYLVRMIQEQNAELDDLMERFAKLSA